MPHGALTAVEYGRCRMVPYSQVKNRVAAWCLIAMLRAELPHGALTAREYGSAAGCHMAKVNDSYASWCHMAKVNNSYASWCLMAMLLEVAAWCLMARVTRGCRMVPHGQSY